MIVRELVTRLGFQVNGGQLDEYEDKTDKIRRAADNAATSFRNMFAAFVGFSAIKSIAKTADEMQSMEARIGMLPQTVMAAGDAFDVVANRANAARASIDAYGNFYVKLQNAGKNFIHTQEEGLQITDTITKALVVGGATAQEQSSALLQFGQAIGSGVFQGDEFRSMGEAAPQFMDELALAMGHPREALKKLASEGKLTAKEVIEAVKKMSVVFDAKFKEMPLTISQATTIMGNRWGMFINKMNRESKTVTKVANLFLAGFDKIEGGLERMVKFFGGATNTIKFFGIALAAALAPMAVHAFIGAFALLTSTAGLVFGALILVGLVLEDLYQYFNDGESVIGKYIAEIKYLTMALTVLAVFIKRQLIASLLLAAGGFIKMAIGIGAIALPIIGLLALLAAVTAFFIYWPEILSAASWALDWLSKQIDKAAASLGEYWDSLKSLFGFSSDVNVNATTVAGAAASPNGVPTANGGSTTNNVTVNQTLPPGTPADTAAAAKAATQQAITPSLDKIARQSGQNL
jgi:tape measure domain-containing protein